MPATAAPPCPTEGTPRDQSPNFSAGHEAPKTGARLTTLDPGAGYVTTINTYAVAPERAEALLDLLVRATNEGLRHVPGFVSANFHVNSDRTQVVNYAQWRSREAIAAARDAPGVAARIREAAQLADGFIHAGPPRAEALRGGSGRLTGLHGMMEAARWLVAFVAVVTAVGGLAADYFIPWSARQHLKNPAWTPHAKFHNGQAILMGLGLGVLALAILFGVQDADTKGLVLSAGITSLYWDCLLVAPIFPGTAWTDPEFEAITPRPWGLHPQQLTGFVLLAILLVAVVLAFLSDRP